LVNAFLILGEENTHKFQTNRCAQNGEFKQLNNNLKICINPIDEKINSENNYYNTNSEINEYEENNYSINNERPEFSHVGESFDVIMTGNLIYRYALNQIELEGFWKINNNSEKESFSYLFQNSHEKCCCVIKKKDIEFSTKEEYKSWNSKDDDYYLNICAANIFEVVLIPNENVFKNLLSFVSGEYHGFFIYYEKTIEDQFVLNFSLDDNQIKITGIYFSLI